MQKQIATIEKQQAQAGKSRAALEKDREKALREKADFEEAKRKKEEAALLKPVQVQKVPLGVDPKTVLCAFFKAGQCEKGAKCKFSHDLNVGRKVEKRNIYEDNREDKAAGTYFVCLPRPPVNNHTLQTRWTSGTRKSCGTSFSRKVETQEPLPMYVPAVSHHQRFLIMGLDRVQILHSSHRGGEVSQSMSNLLIISQHHIHTDTVGSGNVPTAKIACTDMRCHLVSS